MMFATWLLLAGFIVILALVVAIVIGRWTSRRPGRRSLVLVVGRFGSIVYAAIALIGTGVNVVATLVSEAVPVSLPVREFWPGKYPWIDFDPSPAATVVGGGFTQAEVTVAGLDTSARLLLAAGHALEGLTFTLIAVVIALLCHRLLGGSPFRPLLARSVTSTAVTIAVGGIAWQICYGIGGLMASTQVLTTSGWSGRFPDEEIMHFVDESVGIGVTGLPEASLGDMTIDFWPLLLGLALAVVAAAFRYSERLQRDTEGLV